MVRSHCKVLLDGLEEEYAVFYDFGLELPEFCEEEESDSEEEEEIAATHDKMSTDEAEDPTNETVKETDDQRDRRFEVACYRLR